MDRLKANPKDSNVYSMVRQKTYDPKGVAEIQNNIIL